jgi:hypothetical protein
MDGWMKVSQVTEAVVNFPPNLSIHFWAALDYFHVANI